MRRDGYDVRDPAPVPMTRRSTTPSADDAAPPALAAFMRGVERRGLVFAWLLAGSREAGREAHAWTLDRFRDEAARTPFGDWPRRFWAILLGAPALRRPPVAPRWPEGFEPLAAIGHGPRAALLLRLVAGLAESDAATVLGIARPTYRLGLRRALPHRDDGSADVEGWGALGRAPRELLRALPQDAPMVAPFAPGSAAGPARRTGVAGRPPGRGLGLGLGRFAAATVLALAATFVGGDRRPDGLDAAPDGILVEALPEATPAARYSSDDALALHPDLELLLDATDPEPAAADPAFHAWLVVEGAATDGAIPPAPGRAAPARPAGERLAALDPDRRQRLATLRDQWDALSPAERGERRERWQAWSELSTAERQAMREAAAVHALLGSDEQAALRARFDDLDASLRHGWLLGPDLGAEYGRLHPLIAQVPAEARVALLEALRGLDAQGRDDLAVLAARTPPQSRAELRIELLATPSDQRGRWLRQRVAPVQ